MSDWPARGPAPDESRDDLDGPDDGIDPTDFRWTIKQRLFVDFFTGAAGFNGAKACRMAGYSEHTANRIAYELTQKPHIKAAIAERLEALSMSADEATVRLSDWGRGSLAPFVRITAGGDVTVDLSTAEAQANLHLIKKIEVQDARFDEDGNVIVDGRVKIELHDAKDAVIQMAKIHGKFIHRHELSGPGGGPIPHENATAEQLKERARELSNRIAGFFPTTKGDGDGAHP